MIIIQLLGGLGNQMSQYAFGQLLALRYGKKVRYDLTEIINRSDHQGYELPKIFPTIQVKEPSWIEYCHVTHQIPFFTKRLRRLNILIILINKRLPIKKKYIQQYNSLYEEDPQVFLPSFDNIYVIGTFHNYDYSLIDKYLRKVFVFAGVENTIKGEAVSVHVRRGDYVTAGLDIVGVDYYKSAIKLMCQKLSAPVFYIFSDDISYVKNVFTFLRNYQCIYVEDNKNEASYKDMYLISQCKHHIIANSSFSYWGAMLCENPEKIVIRPRMQTKDRETWNVEGWIKL